MAGEVIYKDQPYDVKCETETDLTGVTDPEILYRKPDGTNASVTGVVFGTMLIGAITGAINDSDGRWFFQPSVVFPGDTNATLGTTASLRVHKKWGH